VTHIRLCRYATEHPSVDGYYYVVGVRIVTGEACVGSPSMSIPAIYQRPYRGTDGIRYDSLENESGSHIVIYDDRAAIPFCILKFKSRS